MKKSLFATLSLLLCVALLAMPMVVSASTAVEKTFDPVTTQWYSVDYIRTDATNAADDAYVYTWTPAADGNFTLEADTACKDTLVTLTNKTNSSAKGITLKYYPAGGFTSADGVSCKVTGGNKYEISVMTCSETSGTVDFFAYYESSSSTGLKGAGILSDPYILDGSIKNLPSTKKGQTIYYLLSCDETKKFDLTVKGANSSDSFDLYVENNKSTANSANGEAKVEYITPYAASSYILFSITNKNNGAGGGYSYGLSEAVVSETKGTYEDPATLVLDTLTTAKITSVCYYYTYTATEDGTLSVMVESADNWVCSISGGEAESAYCTASDEPVVNPVEYPVNEGDEISLWVATEAFGAGTVSFTATLKTVEETTAEPTEAVTTVATEPEEIVTTVATEPEEVVTTVATEPEENVTTVSTEPEDVVTTTASEPEENVTTASTEPEEIVTTAPAEPEVVVTTVATEPAATTPVATTAPVASDETYEELYDGYCLSANVLALGDNTITVSKDYDVTLYSFTPSEVAQYKITASDANALVGAYVGSTSFISAAAKGTTNEVTVEFTSGNEILIGVANTSSCTLTVEKVGEVEVEEVIPWNVYENVVEVTKIETDVDVKNLTNVMIYDDVVNSAVLGDDGYYHLDSADGEILYVNLNNNVMSFVSVVDRSKLCAVFYDENGNVTEKIDFTAAVLEYIENSAQIVNGEDTFYFYPLTQDLIEMYQVVGEASDWYGKKGWVGGIEEDAWMFGCYYEAGVTNNGPNVPQNPVVTPGNPSTVPTGRNFTAAYIAVAMMLAAAAVVFFARKRIAE